MKKIIFLLTLLVLTISTFGQSRKPLRGYYVEISLGTGETITTEDIILHTKTVPPDPTSWLFGWVDTTVTMNVVQLDWNGVVTFQFKYEQYYDYYEYWNFFNPFRLRLSPMFITDWIDVSNGSNFYLPDDMPALIANGLANKFNINVSHITVLAYYSN